MRLSIPLYNLKIDNTLEHTRTYLSSSESYLFSWLLKLLIQYSPSWKFEGGKKEQFLAMTCSAKLPSVAAADEANRASKKAVLEMSVQDLNEILTGTGLWWAIPVPTRSKA